MNKKTISLLLSFVLLLSVACPVAFADSDTATHTHTWVDVHGSLHYNLKDQFPQFVKEALTFVPEAYWWAFSMAILFGFVLALYRRMT